MTSGMTTVTMKVWGVPIPLVSLGHTAHNINNDSHISGFGILSQVYFKKAILKKLSKFLEKHLQQKLFYKKDACYRPTMLLKENVRNFQKLKQHKYLIKHYIIWRSFCLKILFLMFLANIIFVVSHWKIHPAVHLIILKALTSL